MAKGLGCGGSGVAARKNANKAKPAGYEGLWLGRRHKKQ